MYPIFPVRTLNPVRWSPHQTKDNLVAKSVPEQCQVVAFDNSNLNLGFIDAITLDQVNGVENIQLIKDIANSVCNREINIQLTLNTPITVSDSNLINKKKIYNKSQQKTEEEIIQDALDIFGGIVIK